MTAAARLAEQILGPERCLKFLDGSPEQSAQLAAWYVAAWHGARFDSLLAEALAAWYRVLNNDRISAWWQRAGALKPALPFEALRRGPAGVMRVEVLESGDWQPVEEPGAGVPAVTWCELRGSPGQAIDLIAMDPSDPARWRARTTLSAVLPHDDAVRYLEPGDTVRLYEHPLAWLAGGCRPGGLVVLDWESSPGQDLLDLIGRAQITAICDDTAHMRRVARLARPKRPAMLLRIPAAPATRMEAAK